MQFLILISTIRFKHYLWNMSFNINHTLRGIIIYYLDNLQIDDKMQDTCLICYHCYLQVFYLP